MNQKYELIPDAGVFRIRALRDIPWHGVESGDLGGRVESSANLSQSGNAWIGENALATDLAQVRDDAYLGGDAYAGDNAVLSDQARAIGAARIVDRAKLGGNAFASDNAFLAGDSQANGTARLVGNAFVPDGAFLLDSGHVLTVSLKTDRWQDLTAYRRQDTTWSVHVDDWCGSYDAFCRMVRDQTWDDSIRELKVNLLSRRELDAFWAEVNAITTLIGARIHRWQA